MQIQYSQQMKYLQLIWGVARKPGKSEPEQRDPLTSSSLLTIYSARGPLSADCQNQGTFFQRVVPKTLNCEGLHIFSYSILIVNYPHCQQYHLGFT